MYRWVPTFQNIVVPSPSGCSTTLKMMAFRSFEISITARRNFGSSQKTRIFNSAVARASNLATNCLIECNYFRVSDKRSQGSRLIGAISVPTVHFTEKFRTTVYTLTRNTHGSSVLRCVIPVVLGQYNVYIYIYRAETYSFILHIATI